MTISTVFVDQRKTKRSAEYCFVVLTETSATTHRYTSQKDAESAREKVSA